MAKKRRGSKTALGIAAIRAIEHELPPEQRIIDDPFARHFVGEYLYRLIHTLSKVGWSARRAPGVIGWLVARERAMDEALIRALNEGIEQLVILGAGYDARAYRFARQLRGVAVFEVDTEATQAAKKERVEMFMDELEMDIKFVPVDLETQTLADALVGAGYDPTRCTFFIWQGVVMYLTPKSVDATLKFIRTQSGAGSSVVFDYVDQDAITGKNPNYEIQRANRYARFGGERIQFGVPGDEAVQWLADRGFTDVENAASESFHARYFHGANESRAVTSGCGILFGRISGVSET